MRASLLVLAVLALGACAPTPPKAAAPSRPATDGVVDAYRTWVLGQADQFVAAAEGFAAAVKAGDRAKAQQLYAPSRAYYERIEPIAEALGDLDPRIDAREGDVDAATWTGYHRIEKVLWSPAALTAAGPLADTLVTDVHLLRAKIEAADIKVTGMVTGAVELLNEVSTHKVTGEEERYSHTDLWDFDANVAGSHEIWTLLSPGAAKVDPELAQKIDARFTTLTGLLDAQKKDQGFKVYTDVPAADVKALSAAVDGLAEALASLGKLYTE